GTLFLVYSLAFLPEDALAVNVELLLLLPAAFAFALLRTPSPRRALAAGVLLGVATLFKPTAALWLLAVPLAGGLRLGACAGAGFALPLAVTAAVFAAQGSLRELVEWTLLHNVGYVTAPM